MFEEASRELAMSGHGHDDEVEMAWNVRAITVVSPSLQFRGQNYFKGGVVF